MKAKMEAAKQNS